MIERQIPFNVLDIEIPEVFEPLFKPSRYKVFYGGRGGAKSWSMTRALIILAIKSKLRILCTRQYQKSIKDSVHRLLKDQIEQLGLSSFFDTNNSEIKCVNGSLFIFAGLHHDIESIKSLEGIDIAWLEEGHKTTFKGWEIFEPTIRKSGSEIWVSMNPELKDDCLYKFFVADEPPEGSVVVKCGWQDNPYFTEELNNSRLHMKKTDPDAYDNVWDGNPKQNSDAQIFKGKWCVDDFETPEDADLLHGVDWGFSQDPTCLIRMFVFDDCLWIDKEVFGHKKDFDVLPFMFDEIETSRTHLLQADCARPDTISYMKKKGFNIVGAPKGKGSIEDGISFIRSFKKIYIHPDCQEVATEFKMYSYKVDKLTNEVLNIILDKWNHGIDAVRYALSPLIKQRGAITSSEFRT